MRDHLARYEKAGVDQIIFVQQSGNNEHKHICESLELFGKTLLPEFKARDALREKQKQLELAPFIEQALKRKRRMPELADADIPVVESLRPQEREGWNGTGLDVRRPRRRHLHSPAGPARQESGERRLGHASCLCLDAR